MGRASSSIQLRGREAVLESFRANDIDVWSIWQGTQFLTKGAGEADLSAFLDLLLRSGSNAIYTVRVYEDLTDAKTVKSNTPDSGSINFRLLEVQPGEAMGGYGSSPLQLQVNATNEKLDRLLELMVRREEEDEEEEDEPGQQGGDIMGAVLGLLKDPEKLEKLVNVGKRLFGPQEMSGALGNVNRLNAPDTSQAPAGVSLSPSPEAEQARMQRIYNAVEKLDSVDAKLADHLEKLATMATANPAGFADLVGMLDIL